MKARSIAVSFELETGLSAIKLKHDLQFYFPKAKTIVCNVIDATKVRPVRNKQVYPGGRKTAKA